MRQHLHQPSGGKAASDSLMLDRIRKAARETLAAWPAARAVLLFGSRARGDHDASSDWDIAVVTGDGPPRPADLPVLDLADDHVNIVFIADSEIRLHRNDLGHLGCALARDAVPLAGRWERPTGLKTPELDRNVYLMVITNALSHMNEALIELRIGLGASNPLSVQRQANFFVERTAIAAGHLAKALLLRHGHEPRRLHDLAGLSGAIAGKDPALAETLRSLNGLTAAGREAHHADAPDVSPDEIARAGERLCRTAGLLAGEFPHYRGHVEDIVLDELDEAAQRLAGVDGPEHGQAAGANRDTVAGVLEDWRERVVIAAGNLQAVREAAAVHPL